MRRNLDALGGLVHSQRVMLALIQAGMSREAAYRAVQRNAMQVWEKGGDFLKLLQADQEVSQHLSAKEARRPLRPRLPHQAGRHDLQARLRQEPIGASGHMAIAG